MKSEADAPPEYMQDTPFEVLDQRLQPPVLAM
jgi:hypothetical protein